MTRQQSSSASLHAAYSYVYIQHMHCLHEKFQKHSLVLPSTTQGCAVFMLLRLRMAPSNSCAMRCIFPPFLNSPLIPAVGLQWRMARCIIPFIKPQFDPCLKTIDKIRDYITQSNAVRVNQSLTRT